MNTMLDSAPVYETPGMESTPTVARTESAPVVRDSPARVETAIIDVLKTCYDPEIPVNIYELGLIYGVKVSDEGDVDVAMTLTSPNCPVAESLPWEVRRKVASVPGVKSVKLNLVWEPPWTPDMMTETAKLELGFF